MKAYSILSGHVTIVQGRWGCQNEKESRWKFPSGSKYEGWFIIIIIIIIIINHVTLKMNYWLCDCCLRTLILMTSTFFFVFLRTWEMIGPASKKMTRLGSGNPCPPLATELWKFGLLHSLSITFSCFNWITVKVRMRKPLNFLSLYRPRNGDGFQGGIQQH